MNSIRLLNCVGVIVGFFRRALLSGGMTSPSIGLVTMNPYRLADRMIEERVSRIFKIDGYPTFSLASPEKYRCSVSGVRSRRQQRIEFRLKAFRDYALIRFLRGLC